MRALILFVHLFVHLDLLFNTILILLTIYSLYHIFNIHAFFFFDIVSSDWLMNIILLLLTMRTPSNCRALHCLVNTILLPLTMRAHRLSDEY